MKSKAGFFSWLRCFPSGFLGFCHCLRICQAAGVPRMQSVEVPVPQISTSVGPGKAVISVGLQNPRQTHLFRIYTR